MPPVCPSPQFIRASRLSAIFRSERLGAPLPPRPSERLCQIAGTATCNRISAYLPHISEFAPPLPSASWMILICNLCSLPLDVLESFNPDIGAFEPGHDINNLDKDLHQKNTQNSRTSTMIQHISLSFLVTIMSTFLVVKSKQFASIGGIGISLVCQRLLPSVRGCVCHSQRWKQLQLTSSISRKTDQRRNLAVWILSPLARPQTCSPNSQTYFRSLRTCHCRSASIANSDDE